MMHRKILVGLALAGTAAYLVAQSSQARIRQGGELPSGGGNSAIAKPTGPSGNAAQQALTHQISLETNYFVDKAMEERRDPVIAFVIEAQCYHVLTVLSDAERRHEINDVWAVDKWQPGGKWNHVTSAPQKARYLLKLTPDQQKQIAAISKELWDSRLAPFNAKTHELYYEKGLKGQAHADAYNAWLEQYWSGKPKSYRSQTAMEHFAKGMPRIRALLTKDQQAEWDAIVAGYQVDLKQAFQGSKSPPDSQ